MGRWTTIAWIFHMHLGSYNQTIRHYELIRELSAAEVQQHNGYKPVLVEARDRLSLFRMLQRNYSEWRNYLNRLLAVDFRENIDRTEELNRLIINYLTVAYTTHTHFGTSLRTRSVRIRSR
jgi:hypothetical protein